MPQKGHRLGPHSYWYHRVQGSSSEWISGIYSLPTSLHWDRKGFLAQTKSPEEDKMFKKLAVQKLHKQGTQAVQPQCSRPPGLLACCWGLTWGGRAATLECHPCQPLTEEQEPGAGARIILVTNKLIVENYNFLSLVYQRWPQNSLWCGQKFLLPPQPLKIGQRHLLWNSQSRP